MSDTSHVLPNGFTYFASTAGYCGTWACDNDPVSAARKAAERNGPYPHFVQVWYAPFETTEVNENGGLSWLPETANTIVPVGFYKLTPSTMKKSKDKRMTHEEFVEFWLEALGNSYEFWLENPKDLDHTIGLESKQAS